MQKLFVKLVIINVFLFNFIYGDLQSSAKIVKEFIDPMLINYNIPGIAVALYSNNQGQVLVFGNANIEEKTPVTADTIFDLASITKVFTATDLALQVQMERMTLADPVIKYLPDMHKTTGAIKNVTLLQLATHFSGLPRTPPQLDKDSNSKVNVLEFLQNWQPEYPIGSRYSYSNLAFGILGYALANSRHKSYEEVIKDDILIPLGMISTMVKVPDNLMDRYATGYRPDGKPAQHWNTGTWPGGGGLRSTGNDMLKFLEANLGVKGPKPLLQAMQFAQEGYKKVNARLEMGLAWQRTELTGMLLIDKNGELPGFSSYIGFIPEKKLGVVILTNKAKIPSTELGRLLLVRLTQK